MSSNGAEGVSGVPQVRVFDPALCCSTGVCGPDVDPDLVRFAADLDWLKGRGVSVERFNLAQQPGAFAADSKARTVLSERGEEGLPLVLVNGVERSSGTYPSRERLAEWTGVELARGIWDAAVAELAAISAAVASNCVSCLSAHEQTARTLGVAPEDIRSAVEMGRAVREAATGRVDMHAERLMSKKRTSIPVSGGSS